MDRRSRFHPSETRPPLFTNFRDSTLADQLNQCRRKLHKAVITSISLRRIEPRRRTRRHLLAVRRRQGTYLGSKLLLAHCLHLSFDRIAIVVGYAVRHDVVASSLVRSDVIQDLSLWCCSTIQAPRLKGHCAICRRSCEDRLNTAQQRDCGD